MNRTARVLNTLFLIKILKPNIYCDPLLMLFNNAAVHRYDYYEYDTLRPLIPLRLDTTDCRQHSRKLIILIDP